MTRTADRPIPPIALDVNAFAGHLVRPVIAVQGRRVVAEWDDPALEWDQDLLEWDQDVVPGFVDATCDLQGAELEAGGPDDHFNFGPGHAVIQLANSTGRWSRFDTTGAQSDYGPGFELAVWALDTDGVSSWLFRGIISRYDDTGDTVVIEAFDAFATLAQPVGTFTAGVNGQTPGPRHAAIMAAAGRSALAARLDTGDVTLTAQATTKAPLEEMQSVASSDAGVLICDADGAVVYLRRNWRNGRTDQTEFPVASDNVCSVPVVVWDAVLSNNDDGQANSVVFENVAKLKAVAPAGLPSGVVFTETDHQWTTQPEGDTVASIVQGAHNDARVNVDEFSLYLFDPRQTLYTAARWRLLDLLRFIHDNHAVGGTVRLDVNTLISTIGHDITADNWVMTVSTSKALSANANPVWNPPGDAYWWDAAGAVWGF